MKEKNGEHPFGDAGQLIFLCIFLVIWVSDSFLLRKSIFITEYIPLYIRLVMSAVSLIIALYLFKSGHVVFSDEKRPARILSSGAFRYIRHPLYSASILFYFGLAAATSSLYSLAFLVVLFIFYNYIASYEERLMIGKFGEDYKTHKNEQASGYLGYWSNSIW